MATMNTAAKRRVVAARARARAERDVRAVQAENLAERTQNAFSFSNYSATSWRICASYLLNEGLSVEQAEAFLRSKHMRWSADEQGQRYGRATSAGLRRYIASKPAGWLAVEAAELAGQGWA